LKNRSIPWATAYGNHDMSKTCSTRDMAIHEQTIGGKLAFTQSMVSGEYESLGTSNYFIPVYSSSGGGNPDIAMLLWFFDSKGGHAFERTDSNGKDVPVADWVDESVVNWFNLEKAAINSANGRVIPSLAFVHIPVHATWAFQHGPGVDSEREPGLNDDPAGHQSMSCDAAGKDCHWNGKDTPFMNALANTEGLMAVFSGHDHGDDWCMKWSDLPNNDPQNGNGIHLCFGRHTGYGGYGEWTRGARQIVVHEGSLKEGREVETWIRLEDGQISGRVILNATYGVDKYTPATETNGKPVLPPI